MWLILVEGTYLVLGSICLYSFRYYIVRLVFSASFKCHETQAESVLVDILTGIIVFVVVSIAFEIVVVVIRISIVVGVVVITIVCRSVFNVIISAAFNTWEGVKNSYFFGRISD